jgi:hypothetical protein
MLGLLRMRRKWADPDWGAQWMPHFAVDPRMGTDAAADWVLALGGRVDINPYDSEFGRIARLPIPPEPPSL